MRFISLELALAVLALLVLGGYALAVWRRREKKRIRDMQDSALW